MIDLIKKEMESQGVSKSELARRLGVTPMAVSQYLKEPANRKPGMDKLIEMAEALGCRWGLHRG